MLRPAFLAGALLLAALTPGLPAPAVAAEMLRPAPAAPDPLHYASAHLADGRVNDAILTLRRAIAPQPESAALHARLGYVYRYAGLTDESLAANARAAELNPDLRASAASQMAKALIYSGDHAGAARRQAQAAEWQRAAGQPLDGKMHFYEGLTALAAGRTDDAGRAFATAQSTGHDSLWAALADAFGLAVRGDRAGTLQAAHRLAARPDIADGERHYRLAQLYAAAGDQERAQAVLNIVVNGNFFNPAALANDVLLAPLRGSAAFAATQRRAGERMAAARKVASGPLPAPRHVLAIHGGGGVRPRAEMTAELEAAYRADLARSLLAGHAVLDAGGTAVDAVEAAVRVMEDSPLFNAGRGSSFNRAGVQEMDAAIMDGRNRNAGGVGIVRTVRNPVSLARQVMEHSPHVLMAAEGAEAFARTQGLEMAPPHYFFTQRKWDSLQERLQRETPYGRTNEADSVAPPMAARGDADWQAFGTVGAVARDGWGDLAAATSTGGREGKLPGRMGDSPIIGAGTFADNQTLAVSSTGLGEYVLRRVSTADIHARMAYAGWTLDRATRNAVEDIRNMGGSIGLVAVDAKGTVAMPFGGRGMYRGVVRQDGAPQVWIYEQ